MLGRSSLITRNALPVFGGRIDPNLNSRNTPEQVSTYVLRSLFVYVTCPLYNRKSSFESDHCWERTHEPPGLTLDGYYLASVFIHDHYDDKSTFIYLMLLVTGRGIASSRAQEYPKQCKTSLCSMLSWNSKEGSYWIMY